MSLVHGGRVLVTGAHGMLGHDLVATLVDDGWHVTAAGRTELDVTLSSACSEAVEGHDVVVNAAAWTSVDDAESNEQEAFEVNALGAENIARAAEKAGARLLHVSTDYVFDGLSSEPYPEDAPLSPVSAYGRTKAEGERRVREVHPDGTLIVRTAWLYGEHGANFVRTVAQLYHERGSLDIVDDQCGQPTWTKDLAEQISRVLSTGHRIGVLHGTNTGRTTWYEFARAIVANLGGDPSDVHPTDSASFPRPAKRPANSTLGQDGWAEVGLTPMRPWREALDEAMHDGSLSGISHLPESPS